MEHHQARARRVARERQLVRAACPTWLSTVKARTVVLTRVAPRLLDDANLWWGLKAVQDEVAGCLGVNDRSVRWKRGSASPEPIPGAAVWRVEQERSDAGLYGVKIAIERA